MFRFLLLTTLAITSYLTILAQPRQLSKEYLPKTVSEIVKCKTEGMLLVLFSNGEWEYRLDSSKIAKIEADFSVKDHWDTTQLFAYKDIPFNALPSVVELKLINEVSDFHVPAQGKVYSKYGPRRGKTHNGTDIPLTVGSPLYATFEGKVRYASYNSGGFGYLVIIRHTNGLETWHGHLSRLNVSVGEVIGAGHIIGYAGNTGRSRGSHLHFEMRYKDQTFDPEFLIDFENGLLRYETFTLEKSFFNINSRASEILEDAEEDYEILSDLLRESPDSAANIFIEKQVEEERARIEESKAVYHVVKSGDMLGKIATRYGVSVSQICRLNNMSKTTILRVGRRLRVK